MIISLDLRSQPSRVPQEASDKREFRNHSLNLSIQSVSIFTILICLVLCWHYVTCFTVDIKQYRRENSGSIGLAIAGTQEDMAILGIGVDVLHLPRVLALIRRRTESRFASRILSAKEFSEWDAMPLDNVQSRLRFLAVRWEIDIHVSSSIYSLILRLRFSIKEAAYKALYPDVRPTWKELTYESASRMKLGMKPHLLFHPLGAASKHPKLHVSVSHDGEYILTSVLAETH